MAVARRLKRALYLECYQQCRCSYFVLGLLVLVLKTFLPLRLRKRFLYNVLITRLSLQLAEVYLEKITEVLGLITF